MENEEILPKNYRRNFILLTILAPLGFVLCLYEMYLAQFIIRVGSDFYLLIILIYSFMALVCWGLLFFRIAYVIDDDGVEVKSENQKVSLSILYIFFIITIIVNIIGGIWFFTFVSTKNNHIYILDDITVEHKTRNEKFDVEVRKVIKEENKEDIYQIAYDNVFFNTIFVSIPASDFEPTVVLGNNTKSSDIYSLIIKTYTKRSDMQYKICLYRYAFLGEKDFSSEEIEKLSQLSLEVFTDANNIFKDYNKKEIKAEISDIVQYAQCDLWLYN